MTIQRHQNGRVTRRALLKNLGLAPVSLHFAPFAGINHFFSDGEGFQAAKSDLFFSDVRFTPHYPAISPLEDILRLVTPGSDEYITERYAFEIGKVLEQWEFVLKSGDFSGLSRFLDRSLRASLLTPTKEVQLRPGDGIESFRREFTGALLPGAERFLQELRGWAGQDAQVTSSSFEMTSIEEVASMPLAVRGRLRYDIAISAKNGYREQRVGWCLTEWVHDVSAADASASWKLRLWQTSTETLTRAKGPVFVDVTHQALGDTASYKLQMLRGSDHWRSILDGACGIDVYGNNGLAAGDYNNDGFDDLYVCQPAGLPNRLYRNRGDGTFEDVTEAAGVAVLDNTSCALFADFRNNGLQDLLVVCASGPLLFLNQGNGTFQVKRDAFKFAQPPQGSFTHAAIADYDRDGRLDIYFCLYSYYLGLDQYHYPVPYFDARNGPPNFLLHNEGDGTFVDRTEGSGLSADNNRYSFACAWGESSSSHLPDLYVVNDFGRNNLYRNNGDSTFSVTSTKAHVEDVGAGMSASWADINNDGNPDLYVSNMWSAAGQRVSQQRRFHERSPENLCELYRHHAEGNALYKNEGEGIFSNDSRQANVEMGRWAWGSDFWDFDHDGYADLYVTNGYISALDEGKAGTPSQGSEATQRSIDLGSFFWRQVVAKSPNDSTPTLAYERGWNALNELIRSDRSWSGHERNVMFANNRDGTFSEVSGIVGLDFIEDGRSFALADLDQDGRLEIILKNRNSPQIRILRNAMAGLGDSIAFRLQGTKSNRDGIGAAITIETGDQRQTKYLQAGSGFLAQHSKEVFFGIGNPPGTIHATVSWPSGLIQQFETLPRNNRIYLEEGLATFKAIPFGPPGAAYTQVGPSAVAATQENPSTSIETWLIDPMKAPGFSLPDLAGEIQKLESLRGSFALLHFWATGSPLSREQLRLFHKNRSAFAGSQLKIMVLNLDKPVNVNKARSFAEQEKFFFPVLFATEEVAGIYNIIYRYLFDRRRDLPIPVSFLLDREGMIVKLYQGLLTSEQLLKDVRSIPTTAAERMQSGLPFPGTLYQSEFGRNDFTYGVAMFQHGYLEQAAESFQQVIAAKPNDAEGYYNLGTLNLRRNDLAQARLYLQKTLKLRPDYPEAWNNLGMIAAQEGHVDEAIQSFQQSIQQRPGFTTALLNLGNLYRRRGNPDKAKESLTRAIVLQPDDPEANYSLGMLYAQQNDLSTAADYLQKAVDLRAGYPEALNNLGVIFVREQDYTRAEQQFKTCIRLAPTFDQSYMNLARLYIAQHDKAKAREALQDLLRVRPDSVNAKQGLQALDSMP